MRSFAVLFIALVAAQSALSAPAEEPLEAVLHPLFGNSRITGGQNAVEGAFPYQVSMWWGWPPFLRLSHSCGGSILSAEWVLSAAHCFTEVPAFGYYEIHAGKYNLDVNEPTQQSSLVARTIIHSGYTGGVAPNDIALVKLATPFVLNAAVSPVALPSADVWHSGDVLLSGWGSVSTTLIPNMPSILQSANLPIVEYTRCTSALSSLIANPPIATSNICTGPLTGGVSACSGDSGGPLVQYNSAGQPELVGVVSWGISPCGFVGAPSVYVRVSAYISWIADNIAAN